MTHTAELNWITPNAEAVIVHDARVSSDPDIASGPDDKLLRYLIKHKHWSPFGMANMSLSVNTTRDISRQFLRHWSLKPQEFSQRYADVSLLGQFVFRECRMQHPTNRQASLPCDDPETEKWWLDVQHEVAEIVGMRYRQALERRIAKEVARAILPEGMTPSLLHLNGGVRDWIHVIESRTDEATQKEARIVAQGMKRHFTEHMPTIASAVWGQE